MKKRKSQITIEFIFAVAVVLIIFFLILAFNIEKRSELGDVQDYLEKRSECFKFANLVSSTFTSGPGTVVNTKTSYVVSVYNGSVLEVKTAENLTLLTTKIAVVVSEAGETTQVFFDEVSNKLSPAWYRVCFSDISGAGCESSGPDVDYTLIPNNLSKLICDELYQYNVVYFEDPTMQYDAMCGSQTYLERVEEWVASGRIAIFAEHIMCRERSSGSYASDSYRCNPPGYNSDVWAVFGKNIHQRGGSYGNDITVIISPDPAFFPNMAANDTFDFEEDSYIENTVGTRVESEDLSFVNGFTDTSSCICSSPSEGRCMRHQGSSSEFANATWTSTLDGTYDLTMRYCGENDGDDDWVIYHNGQQIDAWTTSDNQPNWDDRSIIDLALVSGDTITLSCDRGSGSSYCRSDYLELTSASDPSEFTVVATYDDNSEPGIVYWKHGSGTVFYFGDFQVEINQDTFSSDIIAELIEKVEYFFFRPDLSEVICSYVGNVVSRGEFTGNIQISNEDHEVVVTGLAVQSS